MNLFNQLGKEAAEVLMPGKKPKPIDLLPEQASKSFITKQEAQTILDAMRSASKHNALDYTNVHLHRAKLDDFGQRVQGNPKLWNIAKRSLKDSPIISDTEQEDPRHWSDSYHPWSGDVYLPSGNPAVLLHELGHAADMQEFPHESYVRGFAGNTYRKFAPTLWKEHAAWRKGRKRFLEGAAKTEVNPELVKRTLRDTAQAKPAALGTYWGPRVGSVLGTGLGLLGGLAVLKGTGRMYPQIPLFGGILGGALGLGAGSYIGKKIGGREGTHNEKAMGKYFNEYAKMYSKVHKMDINEAKEKLLSLVNKKVKAKAA
jgi:hypothetical protein